MNWIVDIVTIIISSGTVVALFNYFGNKRKTKIEENKQELDEFREVFNVWKHDNQRLREESLKQQSEISILRQEISDLRNKIVLLESAHQDLPLPAWLKDISGIVLAVNAAYEDTFLIPRGYNAADYIGHSDESVWPQEVAEQYRRHDKMVLRTGRMWHGIESMPMNGADESEEWSVIKYVRYSGRTKIGIAGIAIPKHYEK